jgi:hypothetical protein
VKAGREVTREQQENSKRSSKESRESIEERELGFLIRLRIWASR